MNDDALALVLQRNYFYKRQYFWVLSALFLSYLVIAVLIGALLFLKRHSTYPVYFATDSVGHLIDVVPVNQPNMKTEAVMDWAKAAVEATYSYDFVNYRYQLQNAQKYFTTYGWMKYLSALTASNNLVALQSRRMVVVAQVVDKPRLIVEGVLSGAYAWKFEMPVLVTYWLPPYDANSKFANSLKVTVIVQRQPILQSDKGLGIVQLVGSMVLTAPAAQEISNQPSR